MCKWICFAGVVSCVALLCFGCNPIEDGISAAVEVMILDAFSTAWNTAVVSVTG